jgi:hypothetical protein
MATSKSGVAVGLLVRDDFVPGRIHGDTSGID